MIRANERSGARKLSEQCEANELARGEQEVRASESIAVPRHCGTAQWVEMLLNRHIKLKDINLFLMSSGAIQ